jgi:hypothetical protein
VSQTVQHHISENGIAASCYISCVHFGEEGQLASIGVHHPEPVRTIDDELAICGLDNLGHWCFTRSDRVSL